MAFTDTSLDSGHWCSRQDCSDVLNDVDALVGYNEGRLNRAIDRATAYAKPYLRGRYGPDLPFDSPPANIRDAVAIMAVYALFRQQALPDELDWLREEVREQREHLRRIASGELDLAQESDYETEVGETTGKMGISSGTNWGDTNWGFKDALS